MMGLLRAKTWWCQLIPQAGGLSSVVAVGTCLLAAFRGQHFGASLASSFIKMQLMLALVCVTLAAASTVHYAPNEILLTELERTALNKQDAGPANTQYHEQDTNGFYSYGYSADRSAKAEYLTLDGSSRGFYSYVDADGKLQTVKYEAGRNQGFKVALTNLPKPPKNSNTFAPLPVRDTPEVQEAKKAHFEAYREAELRAALATQRDVANILESTRSKILAILSENANADNLNGGANEELGLDAGQEQEEVELENTEDNDDNNGLLSIDSLQGNQDDSEGNEDDGSASNVDNLAIDNGEERNEARELSSNAARQMTTYKLSDLLSPKTDQFNSRALYTFESDGQRLTALRDKSDRLLTQPKLTSIESVRVPVHSYYTVLAPTTKYTVITPTTHQLVPRDEALKRGHSLPISLSSSFLSHRLKSK
ncbi:unnamed protein product [Ceratitis capitata]|uniref:(Mediterranean fruit fly) hypothetical protein n=1 Tax=Ceratitis capitata TaxID=7213 RepID=A0A811V2W0_CERCA|nr:unnamed protein product [Ceratitis capitata]